MYKKPFFLILFLILVNCSSGPVIEKSISQKWENVGVNLKLSGDFKEISPVNNPNFNYDRAFISSNKSTEIRFYIHDFSRYKKDNSTKKFYETQDGFYLDFSNIWANISGKTPDDVKFIFNPSGISKISYNSDISGVSAWVSPNSEFSKGYNALLLVKAQKKGKGDIFLVVLLKNTDENSLKEYLRISFNSFAFKD